MLLDQAATPAQFPLGVGVVVGVVDDEVAVDIGLVVIVEVVVVVELVAVVMVDDDDESGGVADSLQALTELSISMVQWPRQTEWCLLALHSPFGSLAG
jgi:hypothetical protein